MEFKEIIKDISENNLNNNNNKKKGQETDVDDRRHVENYTNKKRS